MSATITKLLKGTSYNTLGLMANMILNFLLIGVIAQILGIEKLGLIAISALFSIIGLVSLFDFGIPGALTRELSLRIKTKNFVEAAQLFWACVILFCIIGSVISIILLLSLDPIVNGLFKISDDYNAKCSLSIFFMFLSHIYQFPTLILKATFRAMERFGILQSVIVAVEMVRVILNITFLYNGFDFDVVIKINSLVPIIVTFSLWLLLPKNIFSFKQAKNFMDFKFNQTVTLAGYIFIQRIGATVFNNIDRLIAGILLGPFFVGLLEVFSKIPLLINRTLGLAISTIVPAVSGMDFQKDKTKLQDIYNGGFRIYYSVIAPPVFLLLLFTSNILDLWTGLSDETAVICMQIMLLWCLIVPFQFGGHMLIGINKNVKDYTKFISLLSVLKLVLVLLLIEYIGIYALPSSFLIASISTIYLLLVMKKTINISIKSQLRDSLKIIAGSILPILPLIYTKINISSFFDLMIWVIFCYILQIIFIFIFATNVKEKSNIKSFIIGIIKKHK